MRSARGLALVLVGVLSLVAGATDARADLLARVVAVVDDGPTSGGGTTPTTPATTPTTTPATTPATTPTTTPATVDDLSTWAGPARAITLPDLLQQAVRQVPSLLSAQFDIAIAEAQIEQTFARDDWHLQAQLYASSSSSLISGIAIDRTTVIGATADVSRLLPTGGTITLHVGSQYTRATSPINPADINRNWSDELSVSMVQPLLRGRGRWIYEANERRATLSRDAAVLARRLAAIQAVQNVVSAYWDLVLAERQLAITQSSLDLAKERLRLTTLGNLGGKIPRSEIPAVQQIIATREEDILTAELNVLERSLALRRTAGMPIGAGELGLRVTTDLATRDATWDLGQLTERAFAASPELAQLAKQDDVTKLDIAVTENGLLPQLDAALTLGPTGQDEKFTTAWTNLAKFKSIAIAGSLTYEHSLGQEDVRGRARELRANRQKLEVNAFDIRAQIAQTMARAVAQLELARRRVGLSERAIVLAKENIKLETDRFNLGKSTNFDVLGRLEELRQAELRKSQAMIDWHKAESVVQALTGDILPAYGIALQ